MDNLKKALSEVSVIIKEMPEELSSKISIKFKNVIEEEKDREYHPDINELVIKNNMLPETTIILGMIYKDFLCSEEEKQMLKEKERENFQKEHEKKSEMYSYDKLFKQDKNDLLKSLKDEKTLDIQEKESQKLIEIKTKWYKKVLEFFRNIFK